MAFLESTLQQFQYYKLLAEKAMAQVTDEQLNIKPNADTNSIAIIVQHLYGNMRSRWTDFKTTDGEKPWRKRDEEFDEIIMARNVLMQKWEDAWQCLFNAIANTQEAELSNIIYIRNEGHTIQDAFLRQIAHYSYHVGQIVFLAKTFSPGAWESLSIAKGQSEVYNSKKFKEEKSEKHFTKEWLAKK